MDKREWLELPYTQDLRKELLEIRFSTLNAFLGCRCMEEVIRLKTYIEVLDMIIKFLEKEGEEVSFN